MSQLDRYWRETQWTIEHKEWTMKRGTREKERERGNEYKKTMGEENEERMREK